MGEDRPRPRASDRWLTPAVVCVLILTGGGLVALVVVAVALLTVRGYDPAPIVQLAGTMVAAASAFGTFVVQLVTRKTTAKVEREAGRLANGVHGVLDELDATRGRHTYPSGWDDALDDGTAPHAHEGLTAKSAQPRGPGGGPSDGTGRYSDTPPQDLHDTAWYRQ